MMSSTYHQGLVALSIVIAVSIAALGMAFQFRMLPSRRRRRHMRGALRMLSALLVGCAIAGTHNIGIAAASFKQTRIVGSALANQANSSVTWLVIGVGASAVVISGLTMLAFFIGRRMSAQAILLRQQEAEVLRAKQLTEIILHIRRSLKLDDVLNVAVNEVRQALGTDRVVFCRLNPDGSNTIIAEAVVSPWNHLLGQTVNDSVWERCIKTHNDSRVWVSHNIDEVGFAREHLEILERFQIRACMVVPILKDNRLEGLLLCHQCSGVRFWQNMEVELFRQVAIQVGIALEQVSLLDELEQAREVVRLRARTADITEQTQAPEMLRQNQEISQQQVVALLNDIREASKGNLTVRAENYTGEIGVVADFFNAIIENLRYIVARVKHTAEQVNVYVGENSDAMRLLADDALKQAEEITNTLKSLDTMAVSIQAVADSAHQAAIMARTASTTAEVGKSSIDLTVNNITTLRLTMLEAVKKMKRLGESSQEIYRVMALMKQIAMQTNIIAINASIEAAKTGEEGRAFVVVAEEVSQLAVQSTQAIQEIERIVDNIQLETTDVAKAVEEGMIQVVEGADLVRDTKIQLGAILDVSRQIDELVQLISDATVSQAQTSQLVTSLMKQIANDSFHTSEFSRLVSSSLDQTVDMAKQLQDSVAVFKTEEKKEKVIENPMEVEAIDTREYTVSDSVVIYNGNGQYYVKR
jgi:methyl-accepting chemotaxis protein PixJ